MAEKFVQVRKMFDSTLKTPSDMGDGSSIEKKKKTLHGLWTCEERMFYEKIIFLNKSTTKYVIVGMHPITFNPMMKFCDRATGAYFSIDMEKNVFFFRHISSLLDNNFAVDKHEDSGIISEELRPNIWKIKTPNEIGVVIHRVSLEKIIELQDCIFGELNHRLLCMDEYKNTIEKWRADHTDFSERGVLAYLHEIRMGETVGTIKYQAALDLVFNREYLLTLPEYYDFFRPKASDV